MSNRILKKLDIAVFFAACVMAGGLLAFSAFQANAQFTFSPEHISVGDKRFARRFDTLDDAIAATDLTDLTTVVTDRFGSGNAVGDGSGGVYIYRDAPLGTDDGVHFHDVTAGGQLIAQDRSIANILQAGAVPGDSADDRTAITRAVDAAVANSAKVVIPSGVFEMTAFLLDGQDETDYSDTNTEGTFAAGSGYSVSDVITLSNGSTVTVDAVSTGAVTQFTVTSDETGTDADTVTLGVALTQDSVTPSGGTGFTLTPKTDNASSLRKSLSTDIEIAGEGVLQTDGEIELWANPGGITFTLTDFRIEPTTTLVGRALDLRSIEAFANTTMTVDAATGDKQIDVASTTGFAVGDIIDIDSDEAWPYDPDGQGGVKGETAMVESVQDADTLLLVNPLFEAYDAAGDESVAVRAITPLRCKIRGVEIDYGTALTNVPIGIGLTYCADSQISDVFLRGMASKGCDLSHVYNLVWTGGRIDECESDSLGYGIQIMQSTLISINGLSSNRCRHTVDATGGSGHPSHSVRCTGGVWVGLENASPASTHGGANQVTWDSITFVGGFTGVTSRSPNTTIRNCDFYGQLQRAINCLGGPAPVVLNNRQHGESHAGDADLISTENAETFLRIATNGTTAMFDSSVGEMVVRGNVTNSIDNFLLVDSTITAIDRMTVEDNVAVLQNVSGAAETEFVDFQAASVALTDCKIARNTPRDASGDFAFHRAAGTVDWGNTLFEDNENDGSIPAEVAIRRTRYFDTLDQAKAATNLRDGQVVVTKRYSSSHAVGDGSGGEYVYHDSGRSGITEDGGFFHNGAGADDYLELVDRTVANVMQFGAVGDGSTSDHSEFEQTFASAATTVELVVVPYTSTGYSIDTTETITLDESNVTVEFANGAFITCAENWADLPAFQVSGSDNVIHNLRVLETNAAGDNTLKASEPSNIGLSVLGSRNRFMGGKIDGFGFSLASRGGGGDAANNTYIDMEFSNAYGWAEIDSVTYATIDGCKFHGNGLDGLKIQNESSRVPERLVIRRIESYDNGQRDTEAGGAESTNGNGIDLFDGGFQCVIDQAWCHSNFGAGLNCKGGGTDPDMGEFVVSNSNFSDNLSTSGGVTHGVEVGTGPTHGNSNLRLDNVIASGNTGDGFVFFGGYGHRLNGCIAYSNGGSGLQVTGARDITAIGCNFLANETNNLTVGASNSGAQNDKRVRLVGCLLSGSYDQNLTGAIEGSTATIVTPVSIKVFSDSANVQLLSSSLFHGDDTMDASAMLEMSGDDCLIDDCYVYGAYRLAVQQAFGGDTTIRNTIFEETDFSETDRGVIYVAGAELTLDNVQFIQASSTASSNVARVGGGTLNLAGEVSVTNIPNLLHGTVEGTVQHVDKGPYDLLLADGRVVGTGALLGTSAGTPSGALGLTYGTIGTNTTELVTEAASGAIVTNSARWQLTVPEHYQAGWPLKLVVTSAETVGAATVDTVVDAEVYVNDFDGTGPAGDINATGEIDVDGATAEDQEFTVTPTTVGANDQLDVQVTMQSDDTGGSVGTIGEIYRFRLELSN